MFWPRGSDTPGQKKGTSTDFAFEDNAVFSLMILWQLWTKSKAKTRWAFRTKKCLSQEILNTLSIFYQPNAKVKKTTTTKFQLLKILCRESAWAKLSKIKYHMPTLVTKSNKFKYFRRKLPRLSHIFIKLRKIGTLESTPKRFQTGGE